MACKYLKRCHVWHVLRYMLICAVCGTNFDAPSVHMTCKDKPK
jgi:hypothetical protein